MSEFRGRILIADDEEAARRSLGQILAEDGYEVTLAANGEEAMRLVAEESPEVLVTDLRMPGIDGHELLARVRQGFPDVSVVIMTAHGTIRSAVQALREGAEDYLTKPIDVEELEHLLERILKRNRLLAETRLLRERLDDAYRYENIIGRSAEMLEVFRLVEQVAPSQASILITGESGTGKELIAQAIHQRSPRRDAPFVKVSCAALPETLLESELFGHERGAFTGALSRRSGRFEIAAGGTVFLDEIGDIPMGMQVKLLRFLQERQFERLGGNRVLTVDVRILAATHRTLPDLIREGKFRDDLYYRLSMVEIKLPSLAERKEDLPLLERCFIEKFAAMYSKPVPEITPRAQVVLSSYDWPGNVRELENVIGNACMMTEGNTIDVRDLPESLRATGSQKVTFDGELLPLAEVERLHAHRVLESVGGNKVRAAKILGINRATLYRLIERDAGAEEDVSSA